MKIIAKLLEITSYVCVIGASLLFGYTLLATKPKVPSAASGPAPTRLEGQMINLPGVDWSRHDRSLVLAISSHCPYCISSTGFYSTLVQAKKKAHSPVELIAVSPEQQNTLKSFLSSHQVTVDRVESASLAALHVEGTPTLFVVDSHGKITKEWVGKLNPDGEQQVIAALGD